MILLAELLKVAESWSREERFLGWSELRLKHYFLKHLFLEDGEQYQQQWILIKYCFHIRCLCIVYVLFLTCHNQSTSNNLQEKHVFKRNKLTKSKYHTVLNHTVLNPCKCSTLQRFLDFCRIVLRYTNGLQMAWKTTNLIQLLWLFSMLNMVKESLNAAKTTFQYWFFE